MLNNVIFNNSHDHIHSEIERSIEICETLVCNVGEVVLVVQYISTLQFPF